jgi:hypothetical protein
MHLVRVEDLIGDMEWPPQRPASRRWPGGLLPACRRDPLSGEQAVEVVSWAIDARRAALIIMAGAAQRPLRRAIGSVPSGLRA